MQSKRNETHGDTEARRHGDTEKILMHEGPTMKSTPPQRVAETDELNENANCVMREFDITARQLEIPRMLPDFDTYEKIAEELVISERTVQRHVENLFDKTGIGKTGSRTKVRLIMWGIEQGVIVLPPHRKNG